MKTALALPILKSLEECTDFSKTVEVFIPQLYGLPGRIVDALRGDGSLVQLYAEINPLVSGFAISIFLGAVFLAAAEVNRNYSQVDRFWSLLPTCYIAHFALWARLTGLPSQRIDAALLFSTVWSIRLTYNYWRKGGYEIGSEDYRWPIIRKQVPAWAFHILNWTFISFIQSILLFLLAAPAYALLLATKFEQGLSSADLGFVAAELGLIFTQWVADQQQWNFHAAKKEYQSSGKTVPGYKLADLERGFLTSGLWGYSRHPNFACEQSIWFLLYQWSCFACKVSYSWLAVGPVFLIMLFQGSTWLTELITAGKYPEYKDYQRHVGMFVPTRFTAYEKPVKTPKVIRTRELAKKQKQK